MLEGSRDPEEYFILEKDELEPVPKSLWSHGPIPKGRYEALSKLYAGRWHNGLIRAYKAENIAGIDANNASVSSRRFNMLAIFTYCADFSADYLYGDPKVPVSLTLSDVTASFRKGSEDVTFIHAGNYKKITLENVRIKGSKAKELIKSWNPVGKDNLTVKNVSCHLAEKDFLSHPEEDFYCRPI